MLELLVGILIFGALVSAVVPIWRGHRYARASETWPKVRGQVIEAHGFEAPPRGLPKLEYNYTVGGKLYHATAVAFGLPPDRRAFIQAAAHREGDVVWVSYDPENPARAVLYPGGSALRRLLTEPPVLLNLLFSGTLSIVFLVLLLRDLFG